MALGRALRGCRIHRQLRDSSISDNVRDRFPGQHSGVEGGWPLDSRSGELCGFLELLEPKRQPVAIGPRTASAYL